MWRAFLCLLIFSFTVVSLSSEKPKNIVFILADDLGWNDTTIYQSSEFLETPNIQALAAMGTVFTHAYASSPLCSPTRASILTGQNPNRHGSLWPAHHLEREVLTPFLPDSAATNRKSISPQTATRLDTAFPSLSSLLKQNGYHTAHFGKWHLGRAPFSPLEHGFDIDIPNYDGPGPIGGYLAPWDFAPNLQPQVNGEHIDIRLAKEARDWLFDLNDDRPFFLNFWAFSVHSPFNANPDLIDYFTLKRNPLHSQRSATYAAMVKHFDDAVGILMDALKEAELLEDTIIIFTSDNGGNMYDVLGQVHPTSNFPMRAGKATMYEGGTRVPTVVIWPGLSQPNTLTNQPIQSVDFFPTLLNAMSIDWPDSHAIDGQDIRQVLLGEVNHNRPLVTYYPFQPRIPEWLPPSASVTLDNWKLIRSFHYGQIDGHLDQLYDLTSDPFEINELSELYPQKVFDLGLVLDGYFTESNTLLPIVNPEYRQGSFNYEGIGKQIESYMLPEDLTRGDLVLILNSDKAVSYAGETVTVTYSVKGSEKDISIGYRQFMGDKVILNKKTNGFSFVVPEVYIEQYVSFAFVARVNNEQFARKQIGILIKPIEIAPIVSLAQLDAPIDEATLKSVHFNIDVKDLNKDIIKIELISDDLSDESLQYLPVRGKNSINLPDDYDKQFVDLTVSVDDGTAKVEQSITLNVQQRVRSEDADRISESSSGSLGLVSLFLLCLVSAVRSSFIKASPNKDSL